MSRMSTILIPCLIAGALMCLLAGCRAEPQAPREGVNAMNGVSTREEIIADIVRSELQVATLTYRLPRTVKLAVNKPQDIDWKAVETRLASGLEGTNLQLAPMATPEGGQSGLTVIRIAEARTVGERVELSLVIQWGPRLGYGVSTWSDANGIGRKVTMQL